MVQKIVKNNMPLPLGMNLDETLQREMVILSTGLQWAISKRKHKVA